MNEDLTITGEFRRRILRRLRDALRYYNAMIIMLEKQDLMFEDRDRRLLALRAAKGDAEVIIEYLATGKVQPVEDEPPAPETEQ